MTNSLSLALLHHICLQSHQKCCLRMTLYIRQAFSFSTTYSHSPCQLLEAYRNTSRVMQSHLHVRLENVRSRDRFRVCNQVQSPTTVPWRKRPIPALQQHQSHFVLQNVILLNTVCSNSVYKYFFWTLKHV